MRGEYRIRWAPCGKFVAICGVFISFRRTFIAYCSTGRRLPPPVWGMGRASGNYAIIYGIGGVLKKEERNEGIVGRHSRR